MQVRLANDAVDYFEDRYDEPGPKGYGNLYHVAEVGEDDRLTVFEVYERWTHPPQDASRPRRREDDKTKHLAENRRRAVAVYLPGQWRSYRVSPVEPQAAPRKARRKRPYD